MPKEQPYVSKRERITPQEIQRDSGVFIRSSNPELLERPERIMHFLEHLSERQRQSLAKEYDLAQKNLIEVQERILELSPKMEALEAEVNKEKEKLKVLRAEKEQLPKTELEKRERRLIKQYQALFPKNPEPDNFQEIIRALKRSKDLASNVFISQYEEVADVYSRLNRQVRATERVQARLDAAKDALRKARYDAESFAIELSQVVAAIQALFEQTQDVTAPGKKPISDMPRPRVEGIPPTREANIETLSHEDLEEDQDEDLDKAA